MVVKASTQSNTTCANVTISSDNDAIRTATTALVQVCLQNITKCMLTGTIIDHLPTEEIDTVSSQNLSTSASPARNCDDIFVDISHIDGVYEIFTGETFIQVYCEFQPDDHNWLVS